MFLAGYRCTLRRMLNLRKRAAATLEDVSDASKKVGEATELAGVALLALVGISLVALVVAVIALERSSYER